jgi:hypothetical protein
MPCDCLNVRARVTGELYIDDERVMTAVFFCEDCGEQFRTLVATSNDCGVTTHLRIARTGKTAQPHRLAS